MYVLYHDDFDGLASAALLGVWLKQLGEPVLNFVAVDHHHDLGWESTPPKVVEPGQEFCVVDFPYHPGASFWVDHHPRPFRLDEHRDDYLSRADSEQLIWSPAPSCAELIYGRLIIPAIPSQAHRSPYEELSLAANKIDTADYEDPDEAIFGAHPAIQLSQAHGLLSAGQKRDIIWRMMARQSLSRIAEAYVEQIFDAMRRSGTALQDTLEIMEVTGNTVVVDLAAHRVPFVRFAPFLFCPHAEYAFTIFQAGADVRVNLGKNPWLEFDHVDLGSFAREVEGNGHPYAAGATFSSEIYADPAASARAVVAEWTRRLTRA